MSKIPLEFDEPTLRRLYESPPVGPDWPYNGGSPAEVEAFLRDIFYELQRSRLVSVEADFDHCGYASYVEMFCTKKDGSAAVPGRAGDEITGILYYISRLCPIACFGPETRMKGTRGFLNVDTIDRLPPGDWRREHEEVTSLLRRRGFSLPERSVLDEYPPFPVQIPTILSDRPYRIFDMIFHWED